MSAVLLAIPAGGAALAQLPALPGAVEPGRDRPDIAPPAQPDFDFRIETPDRSPVPRAVDDLRDLIKNTINVIHFLGKENPIALRKAEVNKMLGKMDEMAEAGGISMVEPFIVGETIKIIEGPFNDFNGVIEEVNDEKKKLKVMVKIFGRKTPLELSYMQVEKE